MSDFSPLAGTAPPPDGLTVAQAAPLMGLSRRRTRERLIQLDRQFPNRGLLRRPGGPLGNILVNPVALRQIILGQFHGEREDVLERVGLVESDIAVLQARVRRVELAVSERKRGF